MSVPNQTPYIIYNANGLTTVFPFEFYIINTGDIQVTINGTVVTSGYSVSGTGNVGGGDVIFINPPASGSVVMLERVVPTYRLTDYQDNGDLLADTVNKDFDRLWMAIQRSFIYLGLTLRRPLFGGPYDAQGYRIEKGADPVNQQDFATKNYVDNISLVRTLRVPESQVSMLPPASQRANQMLAFNDYGQPITVIPPSGSASDVLVELAKQTGSQKIGYKHSLGDSTARTVQGKLDDAICVLDYGAVPGTDCSLAFNKAIQAAKISASKARRVYAPGANLPYYLKDVSVDCAIIIEGEAKSVATVRPLNDGDTCFIAAANFSVIKGFTFETPIGKSSQSIGIDVRSNLVTIEENSFTFLGTCVNFKKGTGSECRLRYNRYASSQFGVKMPGGQINTHLDNETFADCDTWAYIREDLTSTPAAPTEGLMFNNVLAYACGNASKSMPAFDIKGLRWTWMNNVMIDLSYFTAMNVYDSEFFRVNGGYYSSNQSANSSCVIVKGKSTDFSAIGMTVADSRKWGVEVVKADGNIPARCTFTGLLCHNNDIAAGQQGDLLVDSVTGVTVSDSNLLSNKPTAVAVLDNSGGGADLKLTNTNVLGVAVTGGSTTKISSFGSKSHPDRQVGIVTIPNGSAGATIPSSLKPIISSMSIGVIATAASGVVALSAGMSGTNIQVNRSGTTGDTVVTYEAFVIQ
ncbi:phage tail fiber protein [Enterobacter asburiae]|uniref:phage tail fiber domain-containing protein n=1 Tax=Enterobacter asburiae TaxID=61645 RepID=UPI002FCC2175